MLPDIESLRLLVVYDRDTGTLTWRTRPAGMFANGRHSAEHNAAKWNTRYAGRPAFTVLDNRGYCQGTIFNQKHKAHRVIWALHYGKWPEGPIDHKNGDPSDNKISNLRLVTHAENMRNQKRRADNTSGVTGVGWRESSGKWRAEIRIDGREKHLGYFTDFDAAVAARKDAEREFGYSPNHGRLK